MPVPDETYREDVLQLSRRERQIMEAVFSLGEASVNQVCNAIPDPPGRTAVRTMVRILEEKGHLAHRKEGREFIYSPTHARDSVGRTALSRVLDTFYNGSLVDALAAQLCDDKEPLDDTELEQLGRLIQQARSQGR